MGGLFSSETLERIRAANDIVEVVGSVLPLKRAGANFVALCPFHREKTPSFNVNPHRQIYHCFGCHKGGDVFGFIRDYENVDFPEAVRRLAERARIPLEYSSTPGDQQTRHIKEILLQIHEQITQRWQAMLANDAGGQLARDYVAKRRVPPDSVQLFRLGYAPDSWDDTVNWARSKGHDLDTVEKAGLILRRQEGGGFYDRFRGRLIFPICDEQGRVVAFSGRILAEDQKAAKYVNSPETPIFTKGKVFYGLDKSKRALLEADQAIVCEGQLDLIACYSAGVQNVVAPQGTAFTGEQARLLKRYASEAVLCFDSDEAGQNAVLRSLEHLLAAGIAVRVAVVPPPHDPDSFIKGPGPDAFRQLIQKAEGFFDYHLNRLCATHGLQTDKGRLAVLRGMSETLHKTGNVVLIDQYAQKTALRLGVSPDSVRAEFKKAFRAGAPAAEPDQPTAAAAPVAAPSPNEHWLLKLLLTHEELAAWSAANLNPHWIQHPVVREIVSKRLAAQREGTWTSLPAFLENCTDPAAQNLITAAAAQDKPLPNPGRQLVDVVRKLRNQHVDTELAALLHQASQPGLSDDERLSILRNREALRLLKHQPLAPLELA